MTIPTASGRGSVIPTPDRIVIERDGKWWVAFSTKECRAYGRSPAEALRILLADLPAELSYAG